MPVWVGTIVLPGGSGGGRVIRFREEIDGVGAWDAKRIIENKYGGKMNGVPNIDTRSQNQPSHKDFGINASSFSPPTRISSSTGTSDAAAAGAIIDGIGELAALSIKGAWKLGKFGVNKYQEHKEGKLREVRDANESRISNFFDNPRVFNVIWKFPSSQEFSLDGRQTFTLLEISAILSRYIDDALDYVDDSPEVTAAWQTLLETCEKVKRDLVNNFPDNLSVDTSDNLCHLSASFTTPEDLYSITLLLARLLLRDGEELGSDAIKLQNRLSKSLRVLERICSESLWNSIELPPTPLTKEHLEGPSTEQHEYPDSTQSSDLEEDDLDGEEHEFTHDSEEYVEGNKNSSFDYSSSDAYVSEQEVVTCETSTYGCIWYEREGFSLTPNPEGTLVISEKKIFFIEVDMDISGILAILNNDVDEDGEVRWIFSPDAVSSITKSKVSFRSAYTINTKSGGSYKIVFMPGKGESVIAKFRQLGIKTSF